MRKNRKYTAEFKIEVVKKITEEHIGIKEISRQNSMDSRVVRNWLKIYREYGEAYFYEEHRGNNKGNTYAALHRSKRLSKEERLELENLKLKIENEHLKKGYMVKGVGANGIAKHLNQHGIAKKPRQNGTLDTFSAHFIKLVIQNPVYCGKIAFGRRKTEKINGTRNEYHIVKQEQYPIYDGTHEAIVSVEDWELAQQKRKKLGVKREKIYNLEHEHLLSGLLCCPVCGAAMYGNINRKKKPDGTIYKDHFYYACKHRMKVDGHKCDYHRQWNQTVVNGAVEEVIKSSYLTPNLKRLCVKR